MTEILTLQRRLVEVGRIRLGAKKTSANGKQYPARLTKFRLTSRDKPRLDAAADLYGGEVREWEGAWELYTETDVLPVAVVPGQALNQSYELWGQKDLGGGRKSGVICLRRCDGETEALTGAACICTATDEQVCKPTTRLSVVLTEVPGIGVWRVEAHGWNAAVELVGSVRLLESLVSTGRPVRARLRLDFRQQVTESETRQFVVPVIDIDHTLSQVLDSIGPATRAELPAGEGFQPVPQSLSSAPVSSVADQIAAAPPARRTTVPPIKSTGVEPRSAAERADASGPVCARCGGSLLPPAVPAIVDGQRVHKDGCPEIVAGEADGREASVSATEVSAALGAVAQPLPPETDDGRALKAFMAECGKAFAEARALAPDRQKSKTVDRLRYALTYAETNRRTIHADQLTAEELSACTRRARDITEHRMTYEQIDGGIVFTLNGTDTVVTDDELAALDVGEA